MPFRFVFLRRLLALDLCLSVISFLGQLIASLGNYNAALKPIWTILIRATAVALAEMSSCLSA
jgi:hypothetical protein